MNNPCHPVAPRPAQGGGALVVSFSLARPRRPRTRRSARGGQDRRARPRSTASSRSTRRQGHRLFRQGRSRHRRAHGAGADRGRRARRAAGARHGHPGRHRAHAGPGHDLGQPSIQNGGMQMRQAAATARQALLREAAQAARRAASTISIVDGWRGHAPAAARRVSYGELIGGKRFRAEARCQGRRRPRTRRTTRSSASRCRASTSPTRSPARFTYMQDFRVPGMLHGRVVRPPAIGAKLESVDESSVKDIPGVVKVVRKGNFLGVVAENEWAAIKALRASSRRPGRTGRACPSRPSSGSMSAPPRSPRTRSPATSATPPRRWPGGAKTAHGDLRLRHPHPWLDRPVLRGRRIQGRQADVLVGRRRRPTICASSSRRCFACRPRTCAASMSRAPAATAATATRTPRPTRRCSPRPSASRCACSGRARTSTAGIRRARRR